MALSAGSDASPVESVEDAQCLECRGMLFMRNGAGRERRHPLGRECAEQLPVPRHRCLIEEGSGAALNAARGRG